MPKKLGEFGRPVRKKHHKVWDGFVRKISGGLTIHTPTKGQWVYDGTLFEERMIPVKICCTLKQIKRIADFTRRHYRQLKVCFYKIADEVYIE